MKVSELMALTIADDILLYDKSINKVHSISRSDAPEILQQFYGERTVEAIYGTDFMKIAITIL